MTFETILKVEKSKLETMKQNNKQLHINNKINNHSYNYNRMILNGIKAVQELEAKKCIN